MLAITIKPRWSIHSTQRQNAEVNQSLPARLIEVLTYVHELGSVARAAKALGMSYRHAWELIRLGDLFFEQPLMVLERGRGSTLTALGEKLVWADRRIAARLSPILDTLASEFGAEISKLVGRGLDGLKIEASHGFAVQTLHNLLSVKKIAHEIKYCASTEALAALKAGDCQLAGFHIPTGQFQAACVKYFMPWFDLTTHRVIQIATRRQGLMVATDNPKKIYGLKDLARSDVRFINRQSSSGTRYLLDLMLKKEGIATTQIKGYENSELTHAAVAAYVASEMADVAYGIETPARQFNLDFVPIQTERYFFLCSAASLTTDAVQALLETVQSDVFKRSVNALPGYDARLAGQVLTLKEAFVSLG
jgi:molybdate transport repressor ModE-like protein